MEISLCFANNNAILFARYRTNCNWKLKVTEIKRRTAYTKARDTRCQMRLRVQKSILDIFQSDILKEYKQETIKKKPLQLHITYYTY